SFAFLHDGARLLTSGGKSDCTIKLWDLEKWQVLKQLSGHTKLIHNFALTRDDRTIFSGSTDGTTRAWNIADGTERYRVEGHAARLSPDEKLIVSDSSNDFSVILYDAQNGKELARNRRHQGPIPACTLSGDGKYVASAS